MYFNYSKILFEYQGKIKSYIEIIFKIKEEYIKYTRVNEDGSVHFTLEMPVAEQVCPHCGASTRKSKAKRPINIKFGAIQHYPVTATYLQRRYKCQECNHTFIEKNPFVCHYLRLSKTNMEYLFRQLSEKVSFTEMAKCSDVSVSTIIRYCTKLAIPKPTQLPTVLGIDEYKGNAEGQMCQVIITDLKNHSVVDISPKRDTSPLIQYFKDFSKETREQVKYIVMDISPLFKLVMQTMFPKIINAFVLLYSNGFTEGYKNIIKVLKRISYGFVILNASEFVYFY